MVCWLKAAMVAAVVVSTRRSQLEEHCYVRNACQNLRSVCQSRWNSSRLLLQAGGYVEFHQDMLPKVEVFQPVTMGAMILE
jgi:hypothetical protein